MITGDPSTNARRKFDTSRFSRPPNYPVKRGGTRVDKNVFTPRPTANCETCNLAAQEVVGIVGDRPTIASGGSAAS